MSLNMLVLAAFFLFVCVDAANPRNTPATRVYNWNNAINQAQQMVSGLTADQQAGMVTGTPGQQCSGETTAVPNVFPAICMLDGSMGVNLNGQSTCFPTGINAAQTWNRTQIYTRGNMIGSEFYANGINVMFGPVMNMARSPAAGRNWENFGADPWLTAELAVETVTGVQDAGVIAGAKHFVGNEQETARSYSNSIFDQTTFFEVYGYPFYKSVRANVAGIMCAENAYNGSFSCQNNALLNGVLKGQWGYNGFVMSDWNAASAKTGAAPLGLDVSLPGDGYNDWSLNSLESAVGGTNPSISAATLNAMAVRVATAWYVTGQNANYPPVNIGVNISNITPPHVALSRRMVADSTVVLKNTNNVLPLNIPPGATIAMIGSDAGQPTTEPLNYYHNHNGQNVNNYGFDDGTLTQGWGSGGCGLPYLADPISSFKTRFGSNSVRSLNTNWNIPAAVALARNAYAAFVFVNVDSGEGYITVQGNTGDRQNISLWNQGDLLIQAVAAVNRNTIVVMHITGQVLMPWANLANVSAIILAGTPGQETGNGLADIVSGDVTPSGKLVYTIAKNQTDYPAHPNTTVVSNALVEVNYAEKLLVDYRWFDAHNIQPLYEFGFGLSYTTFAYSGLTILGRALNFPGNGTDDSTVVITVQATITNTGSVSGAETAQLYLGFPAALGKPIRMLRGFEKQFLGVGQSAVYNFLLTSLDLSVWNVTSQMWWVNAGNYSVWVGASSRDLRLASWFLVGPDYTTSTTFGASTSATVSSTVSASSSATTSTSASASTSAASTSSASASISAASVTTIGAASSSSSASTSYSATVKSATSTSSAIASTSSASTAAKSTSASASTSASILASTSASSAAAAAAATSSSSVIATSSSKAASTTSSASTTFGVSSTSTKASTSTGSTTSTAATESSTIATTASTATTVTSTASSSTTTGVSSSSATEASSSSGVSTSSASTASSSSSTTASSSAASSTSSSASSATTASTAVVITEGVSTASSTTASSASSSTTSATHASSSTGASSSSTASEISSVASTTSSKISSTSTHTSTTAAVSNAFQTLPNVLLPTLFMILMVALL